MNILHVVGARPNVMKAAPVVAAFKRHGVRQVVVQMGDQYDGALPGALFNTLETVPASGAQGFDISRSGAAALARGYFAMLADAYAKQRSVTDAAHASSHQARTCSPADAPTGRSSGASRASAARSTSRRSRYSGRIRRRCRS